MEVAIQNAIEAGTINGAVICAANASGSFVYNKAFGERTLLSGEKRPQKVDDVLFLASATKLMAAIAALQCVDEGLLTLDGDLSSIAPELASKQVLLGYAEDDETPLLEPAARPITLRMLLSHTSGLCYHFMNPTVAKWREKFGVPESVRRNVEDLFNYPLIFQPGDGWMYGPGLDWAGRIVERVTGCTLGERMQQRMFGPLGITQSQFFPVTREDMRENMVDLSPDDPEGLGKAVLGGPGEMNKRTLGDFGGHGLFLPGVDYMKVLRSVLVNDGKLLQPKTCDAMFEDQVLTPEAKASYQAALAGPIGPFFRLGTELGTAVGYGLSGLLTLEDIDGWYGKPTLTWGGGITLTWFIDRQNGLCGIGAIQASIPVNRDAIEPLKQVFRRDIYNIYADSKK